MNTKNFVWSDLHADIDMLRRQLKDQELLNVKLNEQNHNLKADLEKQGKAKEAMQRELEEMTDYVI